MSIIDSVADDWKNTKMPDIKAIPLQSKSNFDADIGAVAKGTGKGLVNLAENTAEIVKNVGKQKRPITPAQAAALQKARDVKAALKAAGGPQAPVRSKTKPEAMIAQDPMKEMIPMIPSNFARDDYHPDVAVQGVPDHNEKAVRRLEKQNKLDQQSGLMNRILDNLLTINNKMLAGPIAGAAAVAAEIAPVAGVPPAAAVASVMGQPSPFAGAPQPPSGVRDMPNNPIVRGEGVVPRFTPPAREGPRRSYLHTPTIF